MECAIDIQKYNSILQEDQVYDFLHVLDDRLDKTRSDVLQLKPFPTVEQATLLFVWRCQADCDDLRCRYHSWSNYGIQRDPGKSLPDATETRGYFSEQRKIQVITQNQNTI